MRIHEILSEAATAPLYHGTTFSNALEIVNDGYFLPVTSMGEGSKRYIGISTTRSPRLSHIDHDPFQNSWEKDTIEGFNVVFVLDQNKIRQRNKILPFDWFKDYGHSSMSLYKNVGKLRTARSESEEFIVIGKGNKLPISGNVSKIIYFPNSFRDPDNEPDVDAFLQFRKYALTHNIPVVINRALFGYSEHERPWSKELRNSMIVHPEKNEIVLDPVWYKEILNLAKKYEKIGGSQMSTEQLASEFTKGEQARIWDFWLLLNARAPSLPNGPISNKIFKIVFNSIKNVDPNTNTIYRKIAPFVTKNTPITPEEKRSAGLKNQK